MSRQIRFDDWTFEPDQLRLHRGDSTCKLEPRVARLLEHFLANSGRVMSLDELIDAVWDGRLVSDAAVRRGISALRRALTPECATQYIKTIPKKGYLAGFPAPQQPIVLAESLPGSPAPGPAGFPRLRSLVRVSLLVTLTAILSWTLSRHIPSISATPRGLLQPSAQRCCNVRPLPLTCVMARGAASGDAADANCNVRQPEEFEWTDHCLPSSPSG